MQRTVSFSDSVEELPPGEDEAAEDAEDAEDAYSFIPKQFFTEYDDAAEKELREATPNTAGIPAALNPRTQAFDMFDLDKSGKIEQHELSTLMNALDVVSALVGRTC